MNKQFFNNNTNRDNPKLIDYPARLTAKEASEVLGFEEHDIPVLVNNGSLEPLGKPMPNARKYFAAVQIFSLAQDIGWLNKATKILYQHWQAKNASIHD